MPRTQDIDWGIPKPWDVKVASKWLNGDSKKRNGLNLEKTIGQKKMKTKKIRKEGNIIFEEKKEIKEKREGRRTGGNN